MKEIFRRRARYLPLPERANDANRRVPDNMWISCSRCHELIYAKEYEDNFKVCSKCKYHFRLSPRERLAILLDDDSFVEHDERLCSADPLHFAAGDVRYVDKLEEDRRTAGTREAVTCGVGAVEGQRVSIVVHNSTFRGGSMGVAVGEKVARAIDRAADEDIPLIIVSASGGARQQEGVFALMQMAKTVAALDRLRERKLPYLSILTDPTVGGVPASYALLGDINMAEPGAFIGFAGPRVIEQATKQKLPADVNTAEFMLQHGMIDLVVPRSEMRATVSTLLRLYTARTYAGGQGAGYAALREMAVVDARNGRHAS